MPIVVFPSTVSVPSTFVFPSTLRLLSTSRSSVTFTVPPSESKTRFPEVVLISLAASTPILTLSAVMSVEVIAWLNCTVPVMTCESPAASPIVALPSTCNVPWTTVLPVAEATVNLVPLIAKSLVTSRVPVMSVLPPTSRLVVTSRFAPTYRLRPIPTPPPTIKAPVDAEVASGIE